VSIVTTSFNNGVSFQSGTYPTTNPVAQYYGATTPTPEKSTNYGAGVIIESVRNMTLTVDAYDQPAQPHRPDPAVHRHRRKSRQQPALLGGWTDRFSISPTASHQTAASTRWPPTAHAGPRPSSTSRWPTITNKTKVTGYNRTQHAQRIDAENLRPSTARCSPPTTSDNVPDHPRELLQFVDGGTGLWLHQQRRQPDLGPVHHRHRAAYTFHDHYTLSVGAQNPRATPITPEADLRRRSIR
jgi:iron complex outermembrane receptor protein